MLVCFKKNAFTLIELLAVVAAIAVLAAALVPVVGKARESSRRTRAASNASQIAKAYAIYAAEGGRARAIQASDAHEWALALARETGLNDPRLWVLPEDPLVREMAAEPPAVIGSPDADGVWSVHPQFARMPLSYAVASGLSADAGPRTPVVWTRGLLSTGKWSEQNGVYGSKGGVIAFLDGSAQWFDDLAAGGGRLVSQSQRPTANIDEAIGPRARALESPPAE